MIRLKNPKLTGDTYLPVPEAKPVTLYEIPGTNLPYGCQCPLCGGLFEIPAGVLYKLEEDKLPDKESETDFKNVGGGGGGLGGMPPMGGGGEPPMDEDAGPPMDEEPEGFLEEDSE